MNCLSNARLIVSEMSGIFSTTAIECGETFFSTDCECREEWVTVERLSANFSNVLTMGSANSKYQSILTLGVNLSDIEDFVGQIEDSDEIIDIFGEFSNVYCAMLNDNNEFNSHFGVMNQSVPVLYNSGVPFLPFIAGIEGKLCSQKSWISIGYAIQKID
ncbi:hypothetical protein QA601_08295 [Chitinispirillales bacterium ANBcel5]|uniref:hypothetical protein n=1 Tax=Cellulosispirillum alkaliphilum TaxID=3039283 RepID=UPI002A4F1119|nr:hypothetical protein [Chitinispirillales bacterium ANBcel5]